MSSKDEIIMAGIKLSLEKPTNVALHRLYGWVIWQFPRPQKKGYQGAVRPPEAGSEWIPAVIQADKNHVKLYGHAAKTYPTPEEAVDYFQVNKKNMK